MQVITCADAKSKGDKTYFTGRSCPHGHVAARRVRDKSCLECVRTYKRRYKRSDAWKEQSKAHAKRYRKNAENRHKLAAKHLVQSAVRNGSLVKEPCQKCGSMLRVHAHHDDYSRPLDVKWLCPKHHYERHEELKQKGIAL